MISTAEQMQAYLATGRPQLDDNSNVKVDTATCGTCGRSWNDALITSCTPVPSGRCPFEAWHTVEVRQTVSRVPKAEKRIMVPSCPWCGGSDVIWNMVTWRATSLEPTDLDNSAELSENQCQSETCQGRSFWT